ncbi:MAG: hypothetical protein M3321_08685 [Actinomycetota bacterium]|nr:hypothetical protein [Actinomycetota bacterium]
MPVRATIFQRCHVWLLDNGMDELGIIGARFGGDVDHGLRELDARGVGAIVPKLQDGQQEVNVGLVADLKARFARLGLQRLRLAGGWSQNRGHQNARPDAEKSNGLVVREGCDFWVSTCEDDTYKAEPGTERWQGLTTFVDRCLEIEPMRTMMLRRGAWGFCYLPNEPAGPFFDWASVRRARGRAVAQCYPNEFPNAPRQWPHEALEIGVRGFPQFPPPYGHPLVGQHASRVPVTAMQYLESLQRAKAEKLFTFGYAIYGAHHATVQEWDAYGAVNLQERTPNALALA